MATAKIGTGQSSNNVDLERERAQCSFDIEDFARWWYGGAEELRVKRQIGKLL